MANAKNIFGASIPAAANVYYTTSRNVWVSNTVEGRQAAERVADEAIPDFVEIVKSKSAEENVQKAVDRYNEGVQAVFKDLARAPACINDKIKSVLPCTYIEDNEDDARSRRKRCGSAKRK